MPTFKMHANVATIDHQLLTWDADEEHKYRLLSCNKNYSSPSADVYVWFQDAYFTLYGMRKAYLEP